MSTPKTTPTEAVEIIRELVGNYIDQPDALDIKLQETSDGSCYFAMRGAKRDDGKLIGNAGSHVEALSFLVQQMGSVQGKNWTFRLITNPGEKAVSEMRDPRDVLDFDPKPALDFLAKLLYAFGIAVPITVGPGSGPRNSLTFEFIIWTTTRAAYRELTVPPDDDPDSVFYDMTIIGAIGTLMRACAKKSGVRFVIVAEEPK